MIHTCLSTLIDQREVSHVILAQGAAIKNLRVSREELDAYTAGIVELVELDTKDVLDGATHIIRVQVTTKIDTDVVARQIDALKMNVAAKAELMRLREENILLEQQLQEKQRELLALKSDESIQTLIKERQRFLVELEARELLRRASALYELFPDSKSNIEGRDASTRRISREALGLIDQAIAIYPLYPLSHILRGRFLLKQNNPDEARKSFQYAIDLSRNFKEWPEDKRLAFVAISHHFQGNYHWDRLTKGIGNAEDVADAVVHYLQAINAEPRFAEAYLQHGQVMLMMQMLVEAKEYKNMPSSFIRDFREHSTIMDEAIKYFRDAIKFKDSRTKSGIPLGLTQEEVTIVYLLLADSLEKKGNRVAALHEYKNLLGLLEDTQENRKIIDEIRRKMVELER